jgi:S-adenosylmethionine-diacylglycerol 3-amino-3-carboxypropyl transferase
VCLSIASAGDNALSMVSRAPEHVIAIDLSDAQLACLELRVAAYRELSHPELLELIGSSPSARRPELYRRCRSQLSTAVRSFWDAHRDAVAAGIGGAGKFERYFATFRRRVLPLIHSQYRVAELLRGGAAEERENFYKHRWNSWRWRSLFRVFFSRFVMGRLGRDPAFFNYVEGRVSNRLLDRSHDALTRLNPADNPYLQWILTGHHTTALPHALRPENFDSIRANLDRLEWRRQSVEEFLAEAGPESIDRFNLSDIFEYMSEGNSHALLRRVVDSARPGARIAYWNMLAPRSRPESMSHVLRPLQERSDALHARDKAFFYSRFVLEERV